MMPRGRVTAAYQKLIQGIPLTREDELELERAEYEARMSAQKDEMEKRFLMDPNKAKGLSEVEKRMRMARVYGRRRGGPELFLAEGLRRPEED